MKYARSPLLTILYCGMLWLSVAKIISIIPEPMPTSAKMKLLAFYCLIGGAAVLGWTSGRRGQKRTTTDLEDEQIEPDLRSQTTEEPS